MDTLIKYSKLVIYDDNCALCNKSIQFILNGRPDKFLRFISAKSDIAVKILSFLEIGNNETSIYYIENYKVFTESTAFLKITSLLSSNWSHIHYLIFLPRFIRDFVYRIVSSNRYAMMGSATECKILTLAEREYFIN